MKTLKQMFGNEKERKNLAKTLFVVGVCGAFLGYIGIAVSAIFIMLLPLMVNGAESKEVYGKEADKNIVEKFRGLSTRKKAGVGIAIMLLLPFIGIAIMWLGVVGSVYWIDILFVLPVILIAGFIYFYKKERQTSTIGKVMGNPMMGIIGITIVVLIIANTAYNTYEETKYVGKDVKDYGRPLIYDASDIETRNGSVLYLLDENGIPILDANGQPIPKLKTIDTIILRVVDDFFYAINYQTNLNQTFDADEGKVSLKDTDGKLEVANARVSITMRDEETGKELFATGKKSDASGLVMFTGVPYGTYELAVDSGGYFKFSRLVHFDENFRNQTVNIHLMPIYYRVSVTYRYSESLGSRTDWGIFVHETAGAQVQVLPAYEGGLTASDLSNLKRQQSFYGWSGLVYGGISNEMLKFGQQIDATQNEWSQAFWFLIPIILGALIATPIVAKAGSSTEWYEFKGHYCKVNAAFVRDQTGDQPAYWRQFNTPNNRTLNYNQTDPTQGGTSVTTTSTAAPDYDSSPFSALKERKYTYALWSRSTSEGNTFRAQFNITTITTKFVQYGFESPKYSDVYYWTNVEIQWDTELPSMSTEYWRA